MRATLQLRPPAATNASIPSSWRSSSAWPTQRATARPNSISILKCWPRRRNCARWRAASAICARSMAGVSRFREKPCSRSRADGESGFAGMCRGRSEHALDALEDLVDAAFRIDPAQDLELVVVLDERLGLRGVDLQPVFDDVFVVIRPLGEHRPVLAAIAMRERTGRRRVDVEDPATLLARAPAGKPAKKH